MAQECDIKHVDQFMWCYRYTLYKCIDSAYSTLRATVIIFPLYSSLKYDVKLEHIYTAIYLYHGNILSFGTSARGVFRKSRPCAFTELKSL